ncbi:MAG TPA: LuxR C-terminal-related transcriptional regulator [Acidimicrobiia bacterium]|nr:LuxR C-terminal-related transcriptional regulator [Acidimicrobiia bacterium]
MADRERPESPAEQDIAAAVRASAMPVALWNLVSWRFVELSARAAAVLGIDPTAGDVDFRTVVVDAETARRGVEALRTGIFDGYQARRSLRRSDGTLIEKLVWVRVVDDDRTLALVIFIEPNAGSESGADSDAAVGMLDTGRCIQQISSDVTGLLGYLPEACVGVFLDSLVHPSDVGALLAVFSRVTSDDTNISINVRVRAADGSWRPVHLTLGPTAGETTPFGFAAVRDERITVDAAGAEADRVAQLEQHLTRIAREVEAAGLFGLAGQIPNPERVPGLSELTSRQWQILTRLLQGERVPTIARGMYLSPSTVRNHLSEIYKKLGVHSQAELIERFQPNG